MRTVSPPRPVSLARQGWRDRAACRGEDPDLFFPPEDGNAVDANRKARAICAGCPVAAQCLEFALAAPERWGTWGGKSERQRRDMRAQAGGGPGLCGNGLHLMTPGNTYSGRGGTPTWCRACRRIADEKRRQRAAAARKAA